MDLDPLILKQIGDVQNKVIKTLLGSSEKIILTFECVGKGNTTLRLVYHKSWEAPIENMFQVSVIVN